MFKRKIRSAHKMRTVLKKPLAYSISLIIMGAFFQIGALAPLYAREVKTPPPVSGRDVTIESILPADVLARAKLIQDELAQIRFEMGKSFKEQPSLRVQNAVPRQVFFQALTLFRKANRLSFEQTGRMNFEHNPVSPESIRPFHVWRVVNESLKRVLFIKQTMGISKKWQRYNSPRRQLRLMSLS